MQSHSLGLMASAVADSPDFVFVLKSLEIGKMRAHSKTASVDQSHADVFSLDLRTADSVLRLASLMDKDEKNF